VLQNNLLKLLNLKHPTVSLGHPRFGKPPKHDVHSPPLLFQGSSHF
jgi:hypothetical protein